MITDILYFFTDAIYFICDIFYWLIQESGISPLVFASFIFYCIYRFIFAPLFGNLRAGSSDQVRKKKDDE